MTVSAGFADMLKDVLAPLGRVEVRRMFGGGGVYCDGMMFGLVADDALFLKADAATKAPFEAEGCGPFVYEGKGKPIAMSYWRMPERLLDEPDEMVAWARIALGVARRGAAARTVAKKKAAVAPASKAQRPPAARPPPGRGKAGKAKR